MVRESRRRMTMPVVYEEVSSHLGYRLRKSWGKNRQGWMDQPYQNHAYSPPHNPQVAEGSGLCMPTFKRLILLGCWTVKNLITFSGR